MEIDIKIQKEYMCVCLIEKYLEFEGTGGSLHIILDDGNYTKKDVEFCLQYAIRQNDIFGSAISTLLMEFNEEKITQIVENPWEIKKIFSDQQH